MPMADGWAQPCQADTLRRDAFAKHVGDYVLSDILGTGSFGHVVLGLNQQTSARVAVKVLIKDDSSVRKVSSEATAMERASRGCPFIVQLLEVHIKQHHIYLVMEYADGGELFPICFRPSNARGSDVGDPMREERARTYFQQLVMGVQWCHDKGIAHRDLKPQNLLLGRNRVLKIADFGLAASLSQERGMRQSVRGLRQTQCGSPLYMAPELLCLKEGGTYDVLATDAWGVGAVLYAMLMGRPPMPAGSFKELVSMASRPRIDLRLPHFLSMEIRCILAALLRLDVKHRLTLRQVAQRGWFQVELSSTLARTPSFRPPVALSLSGRQVAESGTSKPRSVPLSPTSSSPAPSAHASARVPTALRGPRRFLHGLLSFRGSGRRRHAALHGNDDASVKAGFARRLHCIISAARGAPTDAKRAASAQPQAHCHSDSPGCSLSCSLMDSLRASFNGSRSRVR